MTIYDFKTERSNILLVGLGIAFCVDSLAGLLIVLIDSLFSTHFSSSLAPIIFFLSLLSVSSVWSLVGYHHLLYVIQMIRTEKERQAAMIDEFYSAPIPDLMGQGDAYSFKSSVSSVPTNYDQHWRSETCKLLTWASRSSIKQSDLVGIGKALASPQQWEEYTNALAQSGYILKRNGVATEIHPRYDSFQDIIQLISHGYKFDHPLTYPPRVRDVNE